MALAVTAMVAAAIATMVSAIANGESTRRDNREYVVRTYSAKTRLVAYVARSYAVLGSDGNNLVLWLHDGRHSGTVHATEIRWLVHNPETQTFDVKWVQFPSTFTEVAAALEDGEHPANADWMNVLADYDAAGYVSTLPLLDGIQQVSISLDPSTPLDATQITFGMTFYTSVPGQLVDQEFSAALLEHHTPVDP